MKKDLTIIYTVTFFIEPPKKGLLVIEPNVVNSNQYRLIKDEVFTLNYDGKISLGETRKNGVVFRCFTSDYSQVGTLVDTIFALAVDLTKYGLSESDSKFNNIKRVDLVPCLDNTKCYILSNKLEKPKCLSNYFLPNEIFYPDVLKGTIKSISNTNKQYFKDVENDNKLFDKKKVKECK